MTKELQKIGADLLTSHWPRCNELAAELAVIGSNEAVEALIAALDARRHHTRSAAIKALVTISGIEKHSIVEKIAALRNDPSYEVRQDVLTALQMLGIEIEP